MAEGDAHGPPSFDLQATDGNVTGRGITVTGSSLRWSGGECLFDDIIAVELMCDTSESLIASCSIIRTDQSPLIVELSGKPRSEPATYRNFVQSFVTELGAARRARIAFRPVGHGNVAAIVWGALLVGSILMMVWALATNQIAAAPENRLIIPTVGLLVPLFALALWKSLHRPTPKPLDPDNLSGSLPPTYYD